MAVSLRLSTCHQQGVCQPVLTHTPPALSVSKVVKAPPATGVSVPGVDKAPPTTGVSVPATVKAPPTTKPPTTKSPTTRPPTAGPPTTRPPVTKPPTTRPPTTGVSTIVKAPPTVPLLTPLIRPPIPPPPKILVHFIRHTKAVQDYDRNNRTIIPATIRNHFPRVGVTHIVTFPLKRTVETSLRIFFPLPPNSPKIQAQIVPALRPVPPPTLFNIPSHPKALRAMLSTGYHAQHRDAVDWSGLPAYPNHSTTLTSHARTPAMNRMMMCADAAREGRG
ncbi:hypothetical protein VE01_01189 [Pseudogymnoascus verrucosus]|uniref:Uncharacterized protein n=1 Tax=Pseudogymnoascus verrucosus TaxID=342668 RepID=A0A1B8GXK3_9PEZI|nr:uncharacterized protein VE01_01189 [Pseudogymnoascus verrucosus]OBU00564.1 hypothetical protein VE01_01189 [Pseudogymnoascus verrucosus]